MWRDCAGPGGWAEWGAHPCCVSESPWALLSLFISSVGCMCEQESLGTKDMRQREFGGWENGVKG